MSVLDAMAAAGHEQVVLVADDRTGLRAIIAIHSTALGPALGGVRFWHYDSESDAIRDALRLSEAMTLKAAAAGLDQGGGKVVVMVDPARPRDEAALRALGRAIHELGGRYIAAEDVGATEQDMNWIALETPWVTGVSVRDGGSGDPSPTTAIGVEAGIRAVLTELTGDPSPAGRRIAVQGTGHVGSNVVRLLVAAGAEVLVADLHPEGPEALERDLGVTVVDHEEILIAECDVLSPCALGAVFTPATIPRLRCRAIAGAANNQLGTIEDGDALHERGIIYAADFIVSAGGIINIAGEFGGYDAERQRERTRGIEQTVGRVLALARERGVSPARAAELLARERIAALSPLASRWRPGSPTAWTQGRPLQRLRGS
jgi:leucine dehydrogenase